MAFLFGATHAGPVWWWPPPKAGDICWCRFPDDQDPEDVGLKARPCLVAWVSPPLSSGSNRVKVVVIYGGTDDPTKPKYQRPSNTEFVIDPTTHPQAFGFSGLSNPTRFRVHRFAALEFNDTYFIARGKAVHPVAGTLLSGGVYHLEINNAYKLALENSKLAGSLRLLDAERKRVEAKQQAESAKRDEVEKEAEP